MSKLKDKVAIVTGASKGIGASIAKHLAAEGASVVVNYSSSKEGADRVVAEIAGKGGRAIAVRANVAKRSEIVSLFAEAKKAFGRLDILVNNAGIYEFSPLEAITEEHFHKLFDLNVLGLIFECAGGGKALWSGGWQHRQYQLGRQHACACECVGLQCHQGSRRCRDQVAGQGIGPAQDPRQFDQSGHGGYGRRSNGGDS